MSIKLNIKRFQSGKSYEESFEVKRVKTLLEALFEIRESQDSSLTFASNCRSGICGECSVRVNDKEQLSCGFKLEDGKTYNIEPLRYHTPERDLVVDKSVVAKKLQDSRAYLEDYKPQTLTPADERLTQIQSDCILCSSCFSSCPVFEVNSDFLGPFALSRVYRYLSDKREKSLQKVELIQQNGVWDCTLCGECSSVCPQGLSPKDDILNLRGKSLQAGFSDPNFTSLDFGFGGF